mmetsp:Transcript_5918/g.11294  ORF Transcript_5918/g.11294 Transcript_5918/m.11294 type:complete len:611 (+) Transcript_5918:655-2487(+)
MASAITIRRPASSMHKPKPKKLNATKLGSGAEELFEDRGRGLRADVRLENTSPNSVDEKSPVISTSLSSLASPPETKQQPSNHSPNARSLFPTMSADNSLKDERSSKGSIIYRSTFEPVAVNQDADVDKYVSEFRTGLSPLPLDLDMGLVLEDAWQSRDQAPVYSQAGDEEEHEVDDGWNWGWNVAGSLGTAIPDKLREIHALLLEDDDVEAPDELVKPIEHLLNQGLEAINTIGRTALAVGTTVDNALEGAINLVHSAAYASLDAMAQDRSPRASLDNRSRSSAACARQRGGGLAQRTRSVGSPAPPPGSGAVGARSPAASSRASAQRGEASGKTSKRASEAWEEDWRDLGPSPAETPGGARKSGTGRHSSLSRVGTISVARGRCAGMARAASKKMAAGKKARADPILDYEQKAFRLEQMLAELRDEMVSSQSHIGPHEAREMHLVVDNLTSSLRDTQMQCQKLRNKNTTPSPELACLSPPPSLVVPTLHTPPPSASTPVAPAPTPTTPSPEIEDPLAEQMRLQMEALLQEKARLASENARLCRENESLHELLDFHHQGMEDGEVDHVNDGHGLQDAKNDAGASAVWDLEVEQGVSSTATRAQCVSLSA